MNNFEGESIRALRAGEVYGTNSREIYLACCKGLGWDETLSHNFGWQKLMYAANADKSGRSVWFLSSNNLMKTRAANFTNIIFDNGNEIEEVFKKPKPKLYDKGDCVTFAKIGTVYVFLGIYKVVSIEGNKKTFERISKNIP